MMRGGKREGRNDRDGRDGRDGRKGFVRRDGGDGGDGGDGRKGYAKREGREGRDGRDERKGFVRRDKRDGGDGRDERKGFVRRDKRDGGDGRKGFVGRDKRDGGDGREERKGFVRRDKRDGGDERKGREGRKEASGYKKSFGPKRERPSEPGKQCDKRKPISPRPDNSDHDRHDSKDRHAAKRHHDHHDRYDRHATKRRHDPHVPDDLVRLNKYLSNAGIASRREADKLILAGVVSVNGKIVTELGYKVSPGDKVQYEGQTLRTEKPQYILLNKPKGYITTVDDPEDRKTVMALIRGACKERVYPVGRLDRNTTGLLLFTNDGNIAKKLTHPRYGIRKIYHVELDKNLSKAHYEKIIEGLQLEDDFIKVDQIEYIEGAASRKEIGVELHSGQNRIVRRIFESLDYKVVRLDRVSYAGLTKKNLPRGKWRFLEEKEINHLKMIK
jgi:23S rRNA pseudouridine2605 synthase